GAPRRRQPAPPPRSQTGPRAPGTAPEKRTQGQGGPQPGDPRRLHGRAAPPAHVQVPVVRVDAGGGGRVLSQLQDVLGLRLAKAKPVAVGAVVRVREPEVPSRDGPQRVAQPEGTRRVSGYREWAGNLARTMGR